MNKCLIALFSLLIMTIFLCGCTSAQSDDINEPTINSSQLSCEIPAGLHVSPINLSYDEKMRQLRLDMNITNIGSDKIRRLTIHINEYDPNETQQLNWIQDMIFNFEPGKLWNYHTFLQDYQENNVFKLVGCDLEPVQ